MILMSLIFKILLTTNGEHPSITSFKTDRL